MRDIAGTEALRAECQNACKKGLGKCTMGCDKQSCPLVAKMNVKYEVVIPGICKATCPTKAFAPPKNCPAPVKPIDGKPANDDAAAEEETEATPVP